MTVVFVLKVVVLQCLETTFVRRFAFKDRVVMICMIADNTAQLDVLNHEEVMGLVTTDAMFQNVIMMMGIVHKN